REAGALLAEVAGGVARAGDREHLQPVTFGEQPGAAAAELEPDALRLPRVDREAGRRDLQLLASRVEPKGPAAGLQLGGRALHPNPQPAAGAQPDPALGDRQPRRDPVEQGRLEAPVGAEASAGAAG